MRKRISAWILSTAVLLSCFISCASSSPTVMTIGGWEVSYDLVRYFAMNYMSDYGDLTPEDFQQDEELQAELEKNVMSSLSQLAAYSQLAKKYNLSLSSSDKAQVESEIQEIRDSYDSTAEYKQALADNFVTEDVLRTIHQISLLCDSLYDYMTDEYYGEFQSDDATIEADIEAGNWFSAEYLYITYEGDSQYESRKEFTEGLLQRLQDGETMSSLYDEYRTTYSLGISYNVLGGFTYTQEKEYFETAVTSMEIGDYSDVIEQTDGFVLIHRLPLDETYIEENFISIFVAGYLEREFFGYVEEYAANLQVTYKKKYENLKFWEIT